MAGGGMKGLAKDTAIYGMSSILGRILNYCLFPLHIYIFSPEEFGKVSYIQGIVAVLFILLTYGMETGFFRFMNKKNEDAGKVYSTSLISLGTTSLLFVLLCICFITPISELMQYQNKEHIMMMAFVVAADAFMAIPFAYLRYQKRPMRFMSLKLTFIGIYILFNLIFLLLAPWLYNNYPDFPLIKFYHPGMGIGYIFLANLIATLSTLLLLIPPTMKDVKFHFDRALLRRILVYSFPLLILGIAGVVNQSVAQITYPLIIFEDKAEAYYQLGIYSASLKIAVIITMFTQAFRYAYEPFFFGKANEKGNTRHYADAMKYFIIFALLVFLAVLFYVDIIEYVMQRIGKSYVAGLQILPIAMMGEILFGVYFNLSVWYKLTDKTKYGAYFSIFGCILQLVINIVFVPVYGYMASAWATLICNLLLVIISYLIGQKYFPIKYDLKNIFLYFILAIVFYLVAIYPDIENDVLRLAYRTIFLVAFASIIVKKDIPLSQIPVINKYFKKKQ